jgi:hypothetical protein
MTDRVTKQRAAAGESISLAILAPLGLRALGIFWPVSLKENI